MAVAAGAFLSAAAANAESGHTLREAGALTALVSPATAPVPATTPAPAPERTQSATASAPAAAPPQRLDYPAAGTGVAVLPLTPTPAELAARSLVPPETKDAYWLTDFGQPGAGSRDTTYIVAHRWIGADAPFNRIGELAKVGDSISLTTASGTLAYRVTAVAHYSKDALSSSHVWDAAPARLVLITCDFSDPWGTNTVITAEPN
jgi:LPXTG-site transpeptidase (sortase) family protein